MKTCSKCKKELEFKEFNKNRSQKGGYNNNCKICHYNYNVIWSSENPTVVNEKSGKWRRNNPKHRSRTASAYAKRYPGKVNAINAKRRCAKISRTPPWLTKDHGEEMKEVYCLAKELSWLSESPLEVDHIVPLQGDNVSGLHVPWNLQILPKCLNCIKNNKFDTIE